MSGPLQDAALAEIARREADQVRVHHAQIEVSADKTVTAEAGGTIHERLSWSAYVKKVWKGPLTAGSTWRW